MNIILNLTNSINLINHMNIKYLKLMIYPLLFKGYYMQIYKNIYYT